MSDFKNNPNIQFDMIIYNPQHQFYRRIKQMILSSTDYQSMEFTILGQYPNQTDTANISATKTPPTTTLAAMEAEIELLIKQTQTPVGTAQSCVQFKIICEKPGSERDGVVLSVPDFNILKQNDHVFTVLPVNPIPFQGIPNISIHDLNLFIDANSTTPVPDVPADDV